MEGRPPARGPGDALVASAGHGPGEIKTGVIVVIEAPALACDGVAVKWRSRPMGKPDPSPFPYVQKSRPPED